MRLATFNLENLDEPKSGDGPDLAMRVRTLRPQLTRLDADLLCLQEVNAQDVPGGGRVFSALDALLDDTPYADYHRAATTNDKGTKPRDVQNLVILSRWPIRQSRQYSHDLVPEPRYRPVTARPAEKAARPVHWDRPILHATVDLGAGRRLDLINLHLRAPLPAVIAGQKQAPFVWNSVGGWAEGTFLAAIKRAGQALETRLLIEQLFDKDADAWIAVCGDFNADGREVPLKTIRGEVEETGNAALADRVLTPLELSLPADRRFTVRHYGERLMLDHIMVSRGLLAHFRGAEIHNELLTDELVAFMTGRQDAESYHAPVLARFELD